MSESSSKDHMSKWTELEEKCAKMTSRTKEEEKRCVRRKKKKKKSPKLKICRWWEPLKSGNNRKRMNIIANNCVPKLKVITYRGPKARESRC